MGVLLIPHPTLTDCLSHGNSEALYNGVMQTPQVQYRSRVEYTSSVEHFPTGPSYQPEVVNFLLHEEM